MTEDRTLRCFDAFPYAERQNQRMLYRGSQIPGWYPSMVHVFPMIVCRVLPVAGMYRPVTYCRTLGHPAAAGRSEVWLGGYEAVLLMDPTGWPVFRIERIFIPPETELSAGEVLETLVEDGRRIATGLGVRRLQVLHLGWPGWASHRWLNWTISRPACRRATDAEIRGSAGPIAGVKRTFFTTAASGPGIAPGTARIIISWPPI